MKKLFVSLLIGLMVGGCFVGCGEKDDKLTPPVNNNKIENILNDNNDEYYDDIDCVLELAVFNLLKYCSAVGGNVTYSSRGSNQLICRITFSELEMENDFGIVDCTKEDFEEFMIEEGLVDKVFEIAKMAQEDVRNEFDPRLEVVLEVYYSTDLMLRVDGNGGIAGL